MTRDEYEQHMQRLAEELRAGVELLEMAHRNQVRALKLVWATTGGEGVEIPPPVVAATVRSVPSPAVPVQAAVPAPVPQPGRRGPWALFNDVQAALAEAPDVFDRNDICRLLGYEPDRGSLYRTFQELIDNGALEIQQSGSGKWPTRYRKKGLSGATAES